ncbi:hypothetical protein PG996_003607 [Apiospora saccharicola]|uniref:Survival Motor Neuron Gemin2-binding domain-containing protein n=1 Tax=Apiospora saccharicola TaxID=335842 RepID=A0ABR1W2Z3_9PEZI
MASNQQNLTHDEVWDDSALVDSWNDALGEYKKYHSIYRHGGNVDDLLKEDEKATVASDAKVESNDSGLQESPSAAEQMQVKDGESMRVSCDRFDGMEVPAKIRKAWHDNVSDILEKNGDEPGESAQTAQPIATPTSRPEGIPAPLLGSVQDEGLKKLMMSWYYAGYYTGLYEGQKQQSQQQ